MDDKEPEPKRKTVVLRIMDNECGDCKVKKGKKRKSKKIFKTRSENKKQSVYH